MFLDTPTVCAKSDWDIPFSARASLRRFLSINLSSIQSPDKSQSHHYGGVNAHNNIDCRNQYFMLLFQLYCFVNKKSRRRRQNYKEISVICAVLQYDPFNNHQRKSYAQPYKPAYALSLANYFKLVEILVLIFLLSFFQNIFFFHKITPPICQVYLSIVF